MKRQRLDLGNEIGQFFIIIIIISNGFSMYVSDLLSKFFTRYCLLLYYKSYMYRALNLYGIQLN